MPPRTPFRRAVDKGHASELSATAKAVCDVREMVAAAPRFAKAQLKRASFFVKKNAAFSAKIDCT